MPSVRGSSNNRFVMTFRGESSLLFVYTTVELSVTNQKGRGSNLLLNPSIAKHQGGYDTIQKGIEVGRARWRSDIADRTTGVLNARPVSWVAKQAPLRNRNRKQVLLFRGL